MAKLNLERDTEKEYIFILMAIFMMANGNGERNMALELTPFMAAAGNFILKLSSQL